MSKFLMLTGSMDIGTELESLAGLARMRPRDTADGGLPERLGLLASRLRELADRADGLAKREGEVA